MTRTFPSELGALAGDTEPLHDLPGGGQKLPGLAVSALLLALSDPHDLLLGTTELFSESLLPDTEE